MADLYGALTALPASADACTGAAASADLIRTHASRARWLSEWVMGEITDGVVTCAPTPAHSKDAPGHDHSGGLVGGTPIVRPLWSASFGYPDASLTTNLIDNGRAPAATLLSTAASGQKAFVFGPGVLRNVWIPGCARDSIAHRKGAVVISVYASHAATLYVQCQDSAVFSQVLTAAAFNDIELSDPVQLIPGERNHIPLTIWIKGSTGGSTWVVTLCSITINQTENTP